MDHIARPQSSVLTTPASSLTDTDTAQLALVQTLSQATRPSSAARAETDCRRMESLVPAQGRLLRLDPALDPALYHALDPALDHAVTGAAALDLAPVFRAADLTAVASSPAASVSVSRPRYCRLQSSSAESVLTTGHLAAPHCQYCQWPPHSTAAVLVYCHHLARPGRWQSAIGRCLPTFK